MARNILRGALVAIALTAGALGATEASASPFGGPHGGIVFHPGFGHGPFGHGPFGHGFGWNHGGWGHVGWGGWGRGWGRGPGWGFGVRPVIYGGCFLKRFVNVYGDLVVRRVCY